MKAREISQQEMERDRVARFGALPLWELQEGDDIPVEARDVFLARRLFSVLCPDGLEGYLKNPAPIRDQSGFALTIAACPPGQGPGLHYHLYTTETFTCLEGRFRVYWGAHGERDVILERWDTISIPPAVIRGFQNVGDTEGYLQIMLTGDVRNMNDVAGTPDQREALLAFGEDVVARLEARGRRFDAGVE